MDEIFCQYLVSISGAKCGLWLKDGGEFCKRHSGKPKKKFVVRGNRFRGNSKWGKESGMFKSNYE